MGDFLISQQPKHPSLGHVALGWNVLVGCRTSFPDSDAWWPLFVRTSAFVAQRGQLPLPHHLPPIATRRLASSSCNSTHNITTLLNLTFCPSLYAVFTRMSCIEANVILSNTVNRHGAAIEMSLIGLLNSSWFLYISGGNMTYRVSTISIRLLKTLFLT